MLSLLDRGFHAVFVIHYSPLKENFKNFFVLCSSVIFHRNADWYYSVYYDESIIKSSVFMVNHAALMLGLSVACSAETTMIFTDKSMIIRQREMISELIKRCLPIFNDFGPFELSRIVDAVIQFRHGGVFYSFLPVPAFIAVNPTLLKNILISNDIDKKTIEKVMELNGDFRRMTDSYLSCGTENNERYIYIFQLEKLLERVRKRTFTSNSLTHSCGKKTVITPKHHAAELRCLISLLETRKNVQIVIASEKDSVFMPQMNCWCKENGYVMLMDRKGFRSCDEGIIVNAASAALEDCVRRVPPERKERDSVISILNDLAEELERDA